MSEQVLIQFRADKELKQEVARIYEELGLDLPTAFRIFLKKSKQVKGLPFDVRLQESKREDFKDAFYALRNEAEDLPEMSLEEINSEIAEARLERKKGHK
jgi:DNA-damage-inducible protein J